MRRRTVVAVVMVVSTGVVLPLLTNLVTNGNAPMWLLVAFVVVAVLVTWYEYQRSRRPDSSAPLAGRDRANAVRWVEQFLRRRGVPDGPDVIALELADRPDAVPPVVDRYVEDHEPWLPAGADVATAFTDSDGQLLVLGTGGSGKTTALLRLAASLLDTARTDEDQPVPVVLDLARWTRWQRRRWSWRRGDPVTEWLLTALRDEYRIGRLVGWSCLRERRLVLLFDGLDEVEPTRRGACLAWINELHDGYGLATVVSCRTEAYEDLRVPVRLRRAVEILPLSRDRVTAHLGASGQAGLAAALAGDDRLWDLVDTPFWLGIMRAVYADPAPVTPDHRRLFARFLRTSLTRERGGHRYPAGRAIRWLAWLAAGADHTAGYPNLSTFYLPEFVGFARRLNAFFALYLPMAPVPLPPALTRRAQALVLPVLLATGGATTTAAVLVHDGWLPGLTAMAVTLAGAVVLGWWYRDPVRPSHDRAPTGRVGWVAAGIGLGLLPIAVAAGLAEFITLAFTLGNRWQPPVAAWWDSHRVMVGSSVVGASVVAVLAAVAVNGWWRARGRPAPTDRAGLAIVGFSGAATGVLVLVLPTAFWVRGRVSPFVMQMTVTAMLGVGVGLASVGALLLVHDLVPEGRRWMGATWTGVGLACAATATAVALAVPVGIPHADQTFWRNAFVVLGIVGGAFAAGALERPALTVATWGLLAAGDRMPWRLRRFLGYAADRGILVRDGYDYRFRHALIQEHLAGLPFTSPAGHPEADRAAAG